DYDGDGRPDILLGNGYHGLRLYRNVLPVAKLVPDLNSDQFPVRDKASRELERLGPAAEPALRKVLEGQPAPEVRQRIEQLLQKYKTMGQNPLPIQPGQPLWFEDVSAPMGLGPDGIGSTVK